MVEMTKHLDFLIRKPVTRRTWDRNGVEETFLSKNALQCYKYGTKIVMQGGEKMKESYKITKAEREVMEVIWEAEEPVRTKTLLDKMKERGKDWKRQTLNTLLFRLEEKGIVNRRRAYVEDALSEEELLQKQTQEILNDLYGGKLENFCAALVGSHPATDEDVDKLYALIDGWGKN